MRSGRADEERCIRSQDPVLEGIVAVLDAPSADEIAAEIIFCNVAQVDLLRVDKACVVSHCVGHHIAGGGLRDAAQLRVGPVVATVTHEPFCLDVRHIGLVNIGVNRAYSGCAVKFVQDHCAMASVAVVRREDIPQRVNHNELVEGVGNISLVKA